MVFPIGEIGAVIRTGDVIHLDVEKRILHLDVPEEELAKRKQSWKPIHREVMRGYVHLYQQHVEQAHRGADMDFLRGGSGSEVTRDSH